MFRKETDGEKEGRKRMRKQIEGKKGVYGIKGHHCDHDSA